MPFTKDNYPNSLKNMTARVRNKTIEIVNALLEERHQEGAAIAIATSKAEEWASNKNIQVFKKERAAAKRSASPSSGKRAQAKKSKSSGQKSR